MKLTKNGLLRVNFRGFPDSDRRLRCNFRCSYCLPTNKNVIKCPFTEEQFKQTKSIWDALATAEDTILVRINFGGETFIDEWAKKCAFYVNKIPNVKICEFVTNNSVNPKTYLNELDIEKTTFNCSFHPESMTIDRFLEYIHILKDAGCDVFANVCAVPQFIHKIPEWQALFKEHGIHLKVQGFITPGFYYNEKRYPEDYTNEERRILQKSFDTQEEYEYFVDLKKTTGLRCYAGVDMVDVYIDGSVKRCFSGSIGNVHDLVSGQIKLKNTPYACYADHCPCSAHFIGLKEFRTKYALSDKFVDRYEVEPRSSPIKVKMVKAIEKIRSYAYKPWTLMWIIRKCTVCVKERRFPEKMNTPKKIIDFIHTAIYAHVLKVKTFLFNLNRAHKPTKVKKKYLYSSPDGKNGKEFLKKIIKAFGYEDFDYLIFVYDDTQFNEEIFKKCTFIHEKGLRWYYLKKYVTPEMVKKYDYIFLWPDDIDVDNFSYKNFIDIMERNNLEYAQPALSGDSYYSFTRTLRDCNYKIGRYTDRIEHMVPVFTQEAWIRLWHIMEPDYNFWGWGYAALAKSKCRYRNIGIVDCETVHHVRPVKSNQTTAPQEEKIFLKKNARYRQGIGITYGSLK